MYVGVVGVKKRVRDGYVVENRSVSVGVGGIWDKRDVVGGESVDNGGKVWR